MVAQHTLIARGGSMFPFVPAGAELTIEAVQPVDLRVGDIVCVINARGEGMAHRLAELVNDGAMMQLRGDASFGLESAPLSALIGRVVHVERGRLRYDTDGPVGQLLARVALEHRVLHRLLSVMGRVAVRVGWTP